MRLRLLQYGYANLPITQTTRKILVKKLRNAMNEQQSKVRGETVAATSFSSGEESDSIDGGMERRKPAGAMRISARPSMVRNRRGINSSSNSNNSSFNNSHVTPVLWGGEESDEDDGRGGYNGFQSTSSSSSPNTSSLNGSQNGSVMDSRKRLMALRSNTLARNNDLTRTSGGGTLNDIVYHAPPELEQERGGSNPRPLNVAISNLVNKLDECYGVKQTFVPCILLSILIAFFVLIAGMYLTIRWTPSLVPEATKFTICQGDFVPTQGCISSHEDVVQALKFVSTVLSELQRRAIASKCGPKGQVNHIMNVRDLISYVLEVEPTSNVQQVLQALHNAQYLVALNPQWRITNVSPDGEELEMTAVATNRPNETSALAILEPVLPISCVIKTKLQKFITIVALLALTVAFLFVTTFIYKCIKSYRDTRKEMVTLLINDITSIVREQSTDEGGAIVINHLRDKLIPLAQRKELEWAWIEAIRFIEENESRIQIEVGNRNGEDCRMMRWIDTSSSSATQHNSSSSSNSDGSGGIGGGGSSSRPNKTWQGPAFDKSNKIKDPPTPCLKIRQMFDKYDATDPAALKQIIQDAILAKVGPTCRIYDVQLEKNSCCVYVRCATNADAGIVHDQINGWWFDNRLISIKFLRLERYLTRFPHAASGPACLQPSSYASIASNSTITNGDADDDMND